MKHLATVLIGAVTLTAMSANGVAADSPGDLRRQVVRFADLDLTRPAAAQELYHRIERAAREVCQAYVIGGFDRSCADAAIARALADVGAPLLLMAGADAMARRQVSAVQQARLDQ
jgi:UrcA family protein